MPESVRAVDCDTHPDLPGILLVICFRWVQLRVIGGRISTL